MAKKKEKAKGAKDAAGPRDAVRGAVEGTFQRAAGGASKAQELLDDVAKTLKSLRDANLVETLESVRDEVQSLARRVAALELSREPAKAAEVRPAARKPAAAKKPAGAAKKPAGAAKKPAGAAKKPASASRGKTTTTATRARAAARKTTTTKKDA